VRERWTAVGAPYLVRRRGYSPDDDVRNLAKVILDLGSDSVSSAAQYDSSGWQLRRVRYDLRLFLGPDAGCDGVPGDLEAVAEASDPV